jgi:hypothetical protein
MPWAAGVYSLPRSWVTDKAGGVAPSAVNFDQQDSDLATAINNCLCKDGQNSMTGNLNMGTHNITNVGQVSATGLFLSTLGGACFIARGTVATVASQAFMQFQNSASTVIGYVGDADAASNNILLYAVSGSLIFGANNVQVLSIDGNGSVSTANTNAREVGWRGAPSRTVTVSGNTAAADNGGTIYLGASAAGQTFTLDADPPTDAVVRIVNRSGNSWTIAASNTLYAAGASGSITLAANTAAEFYHEGGGIWTRTS